ETNDPDRADSSDRAPRPWDLSRLDADALSRWAYSHPESFGIRVLPRPDPARRRQRDRFHHVLRRRVRLRGDPVLSRPRKHEDRVAFVRAHDRRHTACRRRDSVRYIERALHILSPTPRTSGVLHRTHTRRRRFVDRVLQLAAGLLFLETGTSRRKGSARRR